MVRSNHSMGSKSATHRGKSQATGHDHNRGTKGVHQLEVLVFREWKPLTQ